jgi:hypothetical protein
MVWLPEVPCQVVRLSRVTTGRAISKKNWPKNATKIGAGRVRASAGEKQRKPGSQRNAAITAEPAATRGGKLAADYGLKTVELFLGLAVSDLNLSRGLA